MSDMNNSSRNLETLTIKTTHAEGIHFENIEIFPTLGSVLNEEKVRYLHHYNEVRKIINLSPPKHPSENFPNHVATIGDDKKIVIWNIRTNICDKLIQIENSVVDIIKCNYTSDEVISCGEAIQKLDLKTSKEIFLIKSKISNYREFCAIARVNDNIAVISLYNNRFMVLDMITGKTIKRIDANKPEIIPPIKNPEPIQKNNEENGENDDNEEFNDNEKNATRTVTIGNKTYPYVEFNVPKQPVFRFVYTVLGLDTKTYPRHFVSSATDNLIKIVSTDKDNFIDLEGHTDIITCLSLLNDNNFLLSGGFDRQIKKWNLVKKTCEFTLNGHNSMITMVYPTFGDKYFMSNATDSIVKIWDLKDGKYLKSFFFKDGYVKTIVNINRVYDGYFGEYTYKNEKETNNVFVFGDNKGNIIVKKLIDESE